MWTAGIFKHNVGNLTTELEVSQSQKYTNNPTVGVSSGSTAAVWVKSIIFLRALVCKGGRFMNFRLLLENVSVA